MIFIKKDLDNVEIAVSGDGNTWDLSYSFPHNLIGKQEDVVDMKKIVDIVHMSQPDGVAFRYVNAEFTHDQYFRENALDIYITASADPGDEFLPDLMKALDNSIKEDLHAYAEKYERQDAATVPVKNKRQNAAALAEEPAPAYEGYRVYIEDTPVTVPIADKKRADLAFNVISLMSIKGVDFQKDGNLLDGEAHTRLVDSKGNTVELEFDREWYGGPDGNNEAKEAALDEIMAGMIADGAEPDREFEARLMDQYTVCSYDDDHISIRFAPMTWDIDKAAEMQNLMIYGMDPSIDMSLDGRTVDGVHIINRDGDVYEDQLNNNWAKEIVDDGQDFADAVANIPVDDNQAVL